MGSFPLVLAVLSSAAFAAVRGDAQCDPSGSRTNCGYVGITQPECARAGCCWSPVSPNPNNVPWCFAASHPAPTCHPDGLRRNCGYVGITQSQCGQRGCCWNPAGAGSEEPWCYHSNEAPFGGYRVSAVNKNAAGMTIDLSAPGNGTTSYGAPISAPRVQVTYETRQRLHVKIIDTEEQRYEVPPQFLPRPSEPSSAPPQMDYAFSYTTKPFGFAVTRTADGAVLFNTSAAASAHVSPFIFTNQYWELATPLASGASLFGLGEQSLTGGFRLTPGSTYTMWNRDQPAMTTNQNLYGSHPFYLSVAQDGSAHGVFLLNSNGMDIDYEEGSLTYRVIGGLPDFYFFTGPNPADVIRQYQGVIGTPHMPPYWSLGFHQCRYGYPNLQTVEQVVAKYAEANIPLETMWNDIDYMNQYRDWTFDPNNYPVQQMKSFVDQLHANGQKYVVIVDPAIFSDDNSYMPLEEGLAQNVFIKDANGNPCQGKVWPGDTYFPDWTSPNATSYWGSSIGKFLDTVPVDGLWIDMNEPSSFTQGCVGTGSTAADSPASVTAVRTASGAARPGTQAGSSDPSFDPNNPPYTINNCGNGCPLNTKTISMDAMHYPFRLGNPNDLHYNLHNLYGFTESIVTRKALEAKTNKRAFIISRSTFAGSGHHVGHWSGDNASEWPDMQYSINDMLNMGMFGVSLMGSDIGGFLENTTPELMSRWIALGSFYTFCRNHNTKGAASQELYLWPTVANVSRTVITNRYRMLPYMYTLLHDAHTGGDTVWRPLLFEFPSDANTHGIGSQFMVGAGILVTPVLTQGANTVSGYFPSASVWYDWWTGKQLSVPSSGTATLQAPVDTIPVHVRGGHIIPLQQYSGSGSVVRTDPYELVVALDTSGAAQGTLYVDDGESLGDSNPYLGVSFAAAASSGAPATASHKLAASVQTSSYATAASIPWGVVRIFGAQSAPSTVSLNGDNLSASSYSYDSANQVLTVNFPSGVTLGASWAMVWA